MIIVGDIASANRKCSDDLKNIFLKHSHIFRGKSLICNLEGLVCDDFKLTAEVPILFNHSSVLEALKSANLKAVALANNHTLDLPACFESTVHHLTENEIAFAGAGESYEQAAAPLVLEDEGRSVVVYNFCWDFLLYHQRNPSKQVYVAEIREQILISTVAKYRSENPNHSIVVYLHWSFDLETLPFPMYRKFAKDLVDAGTNVVVGCHSHCVQGGEKHGNGYIVYGLGNFFLPYKTFANGRLTFPDFARIQLALEWNPATNVARCHWFEYENRNDRHFLKFISSEEFASSKMLSRFSPFEELSDRQYINFFKLKRRKRFLVPVYRDYHSVWLNYFYTAFLKKRGQVARTLAKMKIRKWQN